MLLVNALLRFIQKILNVWHCLKVPSAVYIMALFFQKLDLAIIYNGKRHVN